MNSDRRKYIRRFELLRARIQTTAGEQRLYSTDVSATGAFFASRDCPELGSRVEVVIRPTGLKLPPLHLEAEVVRCVSPGEAPQPGFALRWIAIHSEVGGDVLYLFLRKVLKVREITRESIGNGRKISYLFPEVGEDFSTSSSVTRISPRSSASPTPSRTRASSSGQDSSRFSQPILRRRPRVDSDTSERLVPSTTDDASKRRSMSTVTSRQSSGVPRAENVMAGATIRRQSGAHAARPSARPAPALATGSRSTGRFSGIPQRERGREDDLMPQRGLNSRSGFGKSATFDARVGGAQNVREEAIFAERSQLFGSSGKDSTFRDRSNSDLNTVVSDKDGNVSVDLPVSYVMEGRFYGATMVVAAPRVVQILTTETPPELSQLIMLNVPVERDGAYCTVYLQGKLMRECERREEDTLFLLHIEQVIEGKQEGVWTEFLTDARRVG